MSNTVIIVGAGPGLSSAIAARFAREGFAVGLVSRSQAQLAAVAEPLTKKGAKVEVASADAGDEGALSNALTQLASRLGTPEVAVYNAAHLAANQPLALTAGALQQTFARDVGGALTLARFLADARPASGSLLLTGGGLALAPSNEWTSLSVGKAALRALALTLAPALAAQNLHVATITIGGFIKAGTAFDPALIADTYWSLHRQPRSAWTHEAVIS